MIPDRTRLFASGNWQSVSGYDEQTMTLQSTVTDVHRTIQLTGNQSNIARSSNMLRPTPTSARPRALKNGLPETRRVERGNVFTPGLRIMIRKVGSCMVLSEAQHTCILKISVHTRAACYPVWISMQALKATK